MKKLLLGIVLIVVLGLGGLVYRNAVEHPMRPIACPLDALVCPDGTAVAREGSACVFPQCPPPNVSLKEIGLAFAVPAGFTPAPAVADSIVAYTDAASTNSIVIYRYSIEASSTAIATIQKTAISEPSGLPISPTQLTSLRIGDRQYTTALLDRSEGVIHTAYYLARGTDVLRFDAIDRDAPNWMDTRLDVGTLPAHSALKKLLLTLQGS